MTSASVALIPHLCPRLTAAFQRSARVHRLRQPRPHPRPMLWSPTVAVDDLSDDCQRGLREYAFVLTVEHASG